MGVAEPGRDADLAQEALGAEHRAEVGVEHLERHLTVMPDVVSQVDRGHAAAAELPLERVAAGQLGPQSGLDVH